MGRWGVAAAVARHANELNRYANEDDATTLNDDDGSSASGHLAAKPQT